MNYDTLDSGLPTPAHVWESQFHSKNRPHRGHLPVAKLRARITLLRSFARLEGTPRDGLKSIRSELKWRLCQLSKAGYTEEATDG